MKRINRENYVTNFHQAKWDEPIIFELSQPGQRGIIVPKVEEEITQMVGDGLSAIPDNISRKNPPMLPEISQPRVLRHFTRLSQETLGADVNIEIGQGTCTVKYSPKVNEALARLPEITEVHPLQDESTTQGILEIMYKTDLIMREISGMDRFSFQPSGGSQAIMAMASIVKNYHREKGLENIKDEIITTIYSHPSDAAASAIKGYKIIYVHPDESGYPSYEAFKEAINERTAAFIVANPEDTGIYNPEILELTKLVHEVDGLCGYDQANANGLLGITRAKESGFDMCFFNLHKSFSSPHGCGGPATGALGVLKSIEKYLPAPLIDFDNNNYYLNYDACCQEFGVGKVRLFNGVAPVVLKAYSWIMSLGAEGLYEVAKVAVLNNNYLYTKLLELECVDVPYKKDIQRIEQVRYTIEKLTNDTGVTSGDIQRRVMDFGMHYWTSHHPYYVPEPITLEPTETPSKQDLDEYIDMLKQIFNEAYTNPDLVKTAPHKSSCHQLDESSLDDPNQWAITWRIYLKNCKKELS